MISVLDVVSIKTFPNPYLPCSEVLRRSFVTSKSCFKQTLDNSVDFDSTVVTFSFLRIHYITIIAPPIPSSKNYSHFSLLNLYDYNLHRYQNQKRNRL